MVDNSIIVIFVLYVLQLGLNIILLFFIGREFIKKRYTTILYLTISTTILLFFQILSSLTPVLKHVLTFSNPNPQYFPTSYLAMIECSALIGIFCMVLFFESFVSEALLNNKNRIYLILITILTTGLIISSFIAESTIASFVTTIPEDSIVGLLGIKYYLEPILNAIKSEYGLSVIIYIIFTFIGIILNFTMAISLLVQIIQIGRKAENKIIKKTVLRMTLVFIFVIFVPLIVIGSLISQLGIQVGIFCILLGIAIFFVFYRSGGMFIIQSRHLRRLLIINSAGIPVYSYLFQHFEESNLEDVADQDILFSGALNAISTLILEFTGTEHTIEEIFFKNLLMMIKQSKDLSVVLVADQSTLFFREALESFSNQLHNFIPNIDPQNMFTEEQRNFTTMLLEQQLGVGGREDASLLDRLRHAEKIIEQPN